MFRNHALLASTLSLLIAPFAVAQTPADLGSGFDTDGENWRVNDSGTVLSWEASGGATGAYLEAQGDGTLWHFQSPLTWAGDWSGYRSLRFELAIPSRHYASNDREDMVEIEGTNGGIMRWNGPTPIWSWTYFEVSLDPAAFGVDQATFDGIMASVAELRILGELTENTDERVGLDNVLLTTTPAQVFSENLIERFTDATVDPDTNSVAGWRPVDDVTFSRADAGRPSYCLYGNDWQDGRFFKIASPISWAGDWSGFTELRFDFRWNSSSGDLTDVTLVTIFGANGQTLSWNTDLLDNEWQQHVIALEPATFGVDQATFDGVMNYVNQIRIHGEFDNGDDQAYLDNVMLVTAPVTPTVFDRNLIARYGADAEGWRGYDNCGLSWESSGGRVDGHIVGEDLGNGIARFQSPDAWSGDWRNFSELRLFLKVFGANRAGLDGELTIATWDGTSISVTLPRAYRSWSPFTIDLVPETFGVSQAEFDAVMGDVAVLWIKSDLVNGFGSADRTGLDEVALLIDPDLNSPPPERVSDFEIDAEGWRGNGWTGSIWTFASTEADHQASGGNPGGRITLDDAETNAGWLSPESWSGDWRGYGSISFDINILQGTSLLSPGWMIGIVSTQGTLFQDVADVPELLTWKHYELPLSADAFGVAQDEFDRHMRDVIAICIRSEWINGSELEALDNVNLSKANADYLLWLGGFLSPAELDDPAVAGTGADPDDDGATNWEEFMALTDPTNPLDRFTATARDESGGVRIEFEARSGRVYQVYRSTTLTPPWTPVGTLITGDDTLQSFMDTTGDSRAYFQVSVSRP